MGKYRASGRVVRAAVRCQRGAVQCGILLAGSCRCQYGASVRFGVAGISAPCLLVRRHNGAVSYLFVGVSARGLIDSGGSTVPATGSCVAVRCQRQVRGGSTMLARGWGP